MSPGSCFCEEMEEENSICFTLYALVSAVLQEVVFREDSEKNGLGVAPRSCFGVQGGCFLSSLTEGSTLPPHTLLLFLTGLKTVWDI